MDFLYSKRERHALREDRRPGHPDGYYGLAREDAGLSKGFMAGVRTNGAGEESEGEMETTDAAAAEAAAEEETPYKAAEDCMLAESGRGGEGFAVLLA